MKNNRKYIYIVVALVIFVFSFFAFKSTDVLYKSHVSSIGWEDWVKNGATSGTKDKQIEAVQIETSDFFLNKGIKYRSYLQGSGWQAWKQNGETSGTTGESKRVEAIQIELTEKLKKKYDVYYRAYSEKIGWLDWAKNGESSGTSGYSYKMEQIEIKLVKKDSQFDGSTKTPYLSKSNE